MTTLATIEGLLWLALVALGLSFQILLIRAAQRDVDACVRGNRLDLLPAALRHRDRAATHIAIKVGMLVLGISQVILPPPVYPGRIKADLLAALILLATVAALDWEGWRDLRYRRSFFPR